VRLLLLGAAVAIGLAAPVSAGTGSVPFVRGDANSDGTVDIGDAISVLGFLFSGGTTPACLDAADANDDGSVDIGDAISILAFLFSGAGALPPPFPAPGVDPTPADPFVCGDPCLPAELCNGIDDDCDGDIDEDATDAIEYYPDVDHDGFGRQGVPPLLSCSPPPDMVSNSGDCDDDDPDRYPGATEFCDGEDDDCDGDVDEDAIDALPFYPDADDDGFGDDSAAAVLACTAPAGHVATRGDCDDDDDGRFPGATEFCDGEDEDCDGTVDEDAIDALPFYPDGDDDGFGDDSAAAVLACTAPAGHVATRGDCDDDDDGRFPGATEFCDGEDDDCDGDVDEDAIDAIAFYPDGDDDGFGDDSAAAVIACTAPPGHVATRGDCDDDDDGRFPGATEFCDGEDDDCDGTVDEDAIDATAFWPDLDGDGYGSSSAPAVLGCTAPPAHVATRSDCDDTEDTTHPGAAELCDGVDQDCDGVADEVALDDLLEPMRPPAAMPRSRSVHDGMLGLDAPDQVGAVSCLYGATIQVPRQECRVTERDLHLPGVGTDFVFERHYRSRRVSVDGPMGHQWEHSYEIRAHLDADGLHLFPGDHREDVLVLQTDGVTYARDGVPLAAHISGVDVFVDFGNGGSWRLEPRGGGGGGGGGWRIAEITDLYANQLLFSYDSSGRLASVLDTVGRVVTCSYDAQGRLATLADGTGRVWSYAYYAAGEPGGSPGDLKSVTTPPITGTPNGNDFPLGRTTTYTYTSGHADDRLNHNLISIIDPRGNVRVSHTYDLDPTSSSPDALLSLEVCGDGYCNDYSFVATCADGSAAVAGATRRVIVNDDRGAVTEHFFDALHRCVMLREFTGFADPGLPTTATTNRPGPPLRPSDPAYFETRYEWNADHRVTRVVHPDGNEVQLVYEVDLDPTALHLARTNLRQVTRTPGTHPGGGGGFASLVDTFEVQPGFGGFAGHEFRTLHTNPRLVTTITVRDAFGNALQVQRALPGSNEDFEYDARGRLTAHVRANHDATALLSGRRRDVFVYPASGPTSGLPSARIVDITGVPRTTSFIHNPRGHLLQVIHPSGNSEFSTPNSLGEVVLHQSRIIASGARYETRCWYDANGNRVRVDLLNRDEDLVVDPANPWLTRICEYDARDCISRLMEEEGIWFVLPGQVDGTGLPASEFVTTEFVHDVAGRLLLERSGVAVSGAQPAAVVSHEYDERGLLYRSTHAPGTVDGSTMQWAYAGNGQPSVLERYGFSSGPRQTSSVYDGYDRLVSTTDPMGNVRSFEYDQNGNVTRTLLHGELADIAGDTGNIRLSEVEWAYDALDRRVSEVAHRFDPATQASINMGERNLNWDFSGGGHLLAVTDHSGDTTALEYDSSERLHRCIDALGNEVELAYDLHSNVISRVDRDLSSVSPGVIDVRTTVFTYDGLDRCTSSTGPLGETRSWAHAWHGIGRVTDERGNVRRIRVDALGRVTRTEADLTASGGGGSPVIGTAIHLHTYDDNGRRVLHIDPNGHPTTYEYDALDRLVRTQRADGTERLATWSAHDERLSEVDPNGTVRSYSYDSLARRVSTSILPAAGVDPSATFESFVYDAEGRVRLAANDATIVTRSYDSLGYGVAESIGALTASCVTDEEGNPTLVTYPSGRQVAYSYDALGRVHDISDAGVVHASFAYLGPSRVERCITGDGLTTDHSYDASGRLSALAATDSSGTTLLAHTYGWDPARNLASRVDLSGSMSTKLHQYDSLERLTQTQSSSPGLPGSLATYQLDLAGNRLFVGGLSFAGPYFMDPTLPAPADAQMHQYTQTPLDQRTYSAAGELSTVTPLSAASPPASYQYDGLGRLRSREEAGTPPVEYEYDALGRRVRVIVGGDASSRVYLFGGVELAVHDGTGAEIVSFARHVFGDHGDFQPVSTRRVGLSGAPEDLYFHHDSAGSVVLLTDSTGAVVERYDYEDHGRVTVRDSFGNPIPASLVGNDRLFHGHTLDPSGRCYHLGGSDYLDPDTGRVLASLDNDTGAIDFVRWGALDVPPGEYAGGNPTSVGAGGSGLPSSSAHYEEGKSVREHTDKVLGLAHVAPELHRPSRVLLTGWWGHCNGWAGAASVVSGYLDPDDDGDGVPTLEEDFDESSARVIHTSPSSGFLHSSSGVAAKSGGERGGGGRGWLHELSLTIEIDRDLYPDAWSYGGAPVGAAVSGSIGRHTPFVRRYVPSARLHSGLNPSSRDLECSGLSAAYSRTAGRKLMCAWVRDVAARGKDIRKNITIRLRPNGSASEKPHRQFNLMDAFPTGWSASSATGATGGGAASEEVRLKFVRFEMQ